MKRIKGILLSGIITLIMGIVRLYLGLNKEDLIIINGISSYRNYIMISNVLLIGFILVTIFVVIKMITKIRVEQIKEIEEQNQIAVNQVHELEDKRNQDSFLSATNKLKETVIREHLKQSYMDEWLSLRNELIGLYQQSEKMDTLQAKLNSLITKNDATVLDDTEDVLEQAEQGLLQNIRKVMNYMDVCDPNVDNEREKVKDSAIKCYKENQQILSTVSDFLISLTEYLNNQGSNDNLKALNTYKEALVGTLTTQKETTLQDTFSTHAMLNTEELVTLTK